MASREGENMGPISSYFAPVEGCAGYHGLLENSSSSYDFVGIPPDDADVPLGLRHGNPIAYSSQPEDQFLLGVEWYPADG